MDKNIPPSKKSDLSKSRTRSRSRSRSRSKSKTTQRNGSKPPQSSSSTSERVKKIPFVLKEEYSAKEWYRDPRLDKLTEKNPKLFFDKQQSHRLFLVLDLDETLVNMNDDARELISVVTRNSGKIDRKIDLRSHLNTFLEEVSRYYDIYLYSLGERPYVDAVKKLLDPTGSLIKPEIYGSDGQVNGSTRKNLKKLNICSSNGPLTDEELIERSIIIDDTIQVWEDQYNQNIIVSKKFFPGKETNSEFERIKSGFTFGYVDRTPVSLSVGMKSLFVDRHSKSKENLEKNQLFYLKYMLIKIAKLYYTRKRLQSCFNEGIGKLLRTERANLFSGKDFIFYSIYSEFSPNVFCLENLILMMGGNLIKKDEIEKNKKKVDYFIVMSHEFQIKDEFFQRNFLNTHKNSCKDRAKPFTIISERWITECFFNYFPLSKKDYIISKVE
jgi:hypothetical protein